MSVLGEAKPYHGELLKETPGLTFHLMEELRLPPPARGGDLKTSPSPCPLPQGGEGFEGLGEGRVGGKPHLSETLIDRQESRADQ